jgi:ABC-2 type transport system permease protein
MRPAVRALTALARTETTLFLRDPLNVLIGVLMPTAILVGLGAVPALREPSEQFGGLRFVDYFASPLLAVSIAVLGLQSLPIGLVTYREKGVLRRMSATPLRPWAVLLVQLLVNAATVAVATGLMVAVAVLGLGVPFPRHPLGFAVTFLVGTAAVFAIGLLIAALVPRAKLANGIGTIGFMVLLFFGGVYLPKFLLPDVVVRIGGFVPPGIEAFADSWTGGGPAPLQLAALAAIAVVAAGAAARLFRWE